MTQMLAANSIETLRAEVILTTVREVLSIINDPTQDSENKTQITDFMRSFKAYELESAIMSMRASSPVISRLKTQIVADLNII